MFIEDNIVTMSLLQLPLTSIGRLSCTCSFFNRWIMGPPMSDFSSVRQDSSFLHRVNSLPLDLRVLLLLDLSLHDLVRLSRTCRYFHNWIMGNLAQEETTRLWRTLYRRELSEIRRPKESYRTDYCEVFKPIPKDCWRNSFPLVIRGYEKYLFLRSTDID